MIYITRPEQQPDGEDPVMHIVTMTEPEFRNLLGQVLAERDRDLAEMRAVRRGPTLGARRPTRAALGLPGNVHPLAGMDGY